MNEHTKQAALKAFRKSYALEHRSWDYTDFSCTAYGPEWEAWLRAFEAGYELATQAAYERAAQKCESICAGTNVELVGKGFAEAIRALAHESGK